MTTTIKPQRHPVTNFRKSHPRSYVLRISLLDPSSWSSNPFIEYTATSRDQEQRYFTPIIVDVTLNNFLIYSIISTFRVVFFIT